MAIPWWDTGTASVVAGGKVVSGLGTVWSAVGVQAGDMLVLGGLVGIVASVTSDTAIVLDQPWAGTTISGVPHCVVQVSATPSGVQKSVSTLLAGWQGSRDEFATWLSGTETGGPNNNGTYPMTAPDGTVKYVRSPANILKFMDASVVSNAASIVAALTDDVAAINELAQTVALQARQVASDASTVAANTTTTTTAASAATTKATEAASARDEAVSAKSAVLVAKSAVDQAASDVSANAATVAANTTTTTTAASAATGAASAANTSSATATAAAVTAVQARDTAVAGAATATQSATTAVSAKAAAETDRDAAASSAEAARAAEVSATSAATRATNAAAQAVAVVGGAGFSVVSDGVSAQFTASESGDTLSIVPAAGVLITFDAATKTVRLGADSSWLSTQLLLHDLLS